MSPAVDPELMKQIIVSGGSTRREAESPARFKAGDQVVARIMNPIGHTRLPRYVRGRRGTVHHDHGSFVFPDTNAHLKGEHPQHVYTVEFTARELWGPEASEKDKLYIDLWDSYLDPTK